MKRLMVLIVGLVFLFTTSVIAQTAAPTKGEKKAAGIQLASDKKDDKKKKKDEKKEEKEEAVKKTPAKKPPVKREEPKK